ncbi:immunoglobulin-like domain-containing protein [Priestia koreensis]|uniref:immunoglobulin-like domain-containing protein n=1 Tax=Priestia koreensis TaxID=284581 RepID=UPI003D0289C6
MQKTKIFATGLLCAFLLAACQSVNAEPKAQDPFKNQGHVASKNGVSIYSERSQYLLSSDDVSVKVKNDSDNTLNSDSFGLLERSVDGVWKSIPLKKDMTTTMTLESKLLPSKSKETKTFNLKNVAGLKPGKYRIVYTFVDGKKPFNVAAPFKLVNK